MSEILTLGIPKGSLESATIDLFKRSGWRIKIYSRNYFPGIDDPEVRCIMARAQEMSRFVEQGTLDVGLTGKDWTLENGSDVVVVTNEVVSDVKGYQVITSSHPIPDERSLFAAGEVLKRFQNLCFCDC